MGGITAMALAFSNARVAPTAAPLVSKVLASLDRYAKGLKHKVSKPFTANLSYKTYRQLVNKGVLAV